MSTSKNIDRMNAFERALKRIGDFLGAAFLIILLSPLLLLIFIVYKLTGCGEVIYSQERIGLGGKPFKIYKFRTMIQEAECDGIPILESPDDNRLLKYGKWMRTKHIDELPQLFNVLKGDMSFVGYRPERQYFIDQIMKQNPDYELLFVSRPGVTSIATVYNGYTDTIDKMLKRLELDLEYLRNRTLLLDLKILFYTIVHI